MTSNGPEDTSGKPGQAGDAVLEKLLERYERFHHDLDSLYVIDDEKALYRRLVEVVDDTVNPIYFNLAEYPLHFGEEPRVLQEKELPTDAGANPFTISDEILRWALGIDEASVIPLTVEVFEQTGARTLVIVPVSFEPGRRLVLFAWCAEDENDLSKFLFNMFNSLARAARHTIQTVRHRKKTDAVYSLLSEIIESVPLGIVALKSNDEVSLVNTNAEFLFRIERNKVLNSRYQETFPRAIREVLDTLAVATLRGEGVFDHEFEYAIDSRTTLNIGISSSLMYDWQGNVSGMIFICRDLSLSREVQKLRELDEMKSDFVHTVSHELKTPLTAILGGIEILGMDKDSLSEEQIEIVDIIDEAARRLHSLITDILDLSRLESGKVGLSEEITDIGQLLRETANVFRARGNYKIDMNVAEDLPPAYIDKGKIMQVVENFISNAIKYNSHRPEIEVKAFINPRKYIEIQVADNGIGISADALNRIWDKFYRVDSSASARVEGTGLGLSIAKYIVELHGGEIGVESVAGAGSTFSFTVPVPDISSVTSP